MFTILGSIFFSVIHVPVNVPALSATTGFEADINKELKVCSVWRVRTTSPFRFPRADELEGDLARCPRLSPVVSLAACACRLTPYLPF